MKHTRTVIRIPASVQNAVRKAAAEQNAIREKNAKNPVVLRRSYDLSAALCRRQTKDSDAPAVLHMNGTCETPLLRCMLLGAAACGLVLSFCMLKRMCLAAKLRRRYARRYADMLRTQKMHMREYRFRRENACGTKYGNKKMPAESADTSDCRGAKHEA